MHLTSAQLQTLKADILASPDLNTIPLSEDGNQAIADAYNALASPSFIVWKTAVPIAQVGQAMNSNEVAGLTTANTNRLQVMAAYSGGGFNPSLPDVRAGFDNVFSGAGGVNTRAALLALWKQAATRAGKLFATGTGTDASPATLGVDKNGNYLMTMDRQDVEKARNS